MFLPSLRFAARALLRSPGFTLLAIITLALGIGANTAMFSMLNSILLKPLPYPESEQLDRIDRVTAQNPSGRISPADFLDAQRQMSGYGELAGTMLEDTSVSEPGQSPEMVRAIRVSANYLSMLRVQPQLGRDFLPRENVAGNDRVVLIGHRCWERRFGGRTDVIGRTIRVDGEPHEIIGVLPKWANDWRHLGPYDFFRPLVFNQQQGADRRTTNVRLLGRRSSAVPAAQTIGFIANFGGRLAKDFPDVNAGSTWRVSRLNSSVVPKSVPLMMGMIIGLSLFVLLIACSNLANLLLARTMARAREFAVRSALGASRSQLLRPLIAESLLLALGGGVCSMIVARWGVDWLSLRTLSDNGERVMFDFDWHVFAWAFVASGVTAIAFGLAPALFALRLNVNHTLKSGARGMTGGRGHERFRQGLIIGQFALAMILLTGAALFVRGLDDLNTRRDGWESRNVVTGTIVLPAATYGSPEKIATFQRLVLERIESMPGVAAASICSFTPFFNWADVRKYVIAGRELPPAGQEPAATVNTVSPHYFAAFGTRLVAGRAFDGRDIGGAPRVFIISENTAKGLFGKESPVGHRIAQTGSGTPQWGEIVGVAAEVKSVVADPGPVTYQLYQAAAQEPRPYVQIAVRAAGIPPATLVPGIRQLMTDLDPDLPLRSLEPGDATIERANDQISIIRDMLTAFAVLGLGLASLGIYGVIARTMAQRAGEFAIRFALGASIQDITQIVLTAGIRLAVIGSAIGLLGAIGISQFLRGLFPGMRMSSPPVLVATTLVLVVVALVACWLPARRAAAINPLEALRAE